MSTDKTFCIHEGCKNYACWRHIDRAPTGRPISVADLAGLYNCSCGTPAKDIARKAMLTAICRGTQNTAYACNDACKAMCDRAGGCAFCEAIANEVETEYTPIVEARWLDVTRPGQVTCGGNPVYACSNCGGVYGSHELFPTARYCRECGARMKGLV